MYILSRKTNKKGSQNLFREVRFWWCRWDLCSSGLLCSIGLFVTNILGKHIQPIFKSHVQAEKFSSWTTYDMQQPGKVMIIMWR